MPASNPHVSEHLQRFGGPRQSLRRTEHPSIPPVDAGKGARENLGGRDA